MIEQLLTASAGWLWEKFGARLITEGTQGAEKQWVKFQWAAAEEKYRERLIEQINTIRLLGNPRPLQIDAFYTDVHVLDELSAFRHFDLATRSGSSDDIERMASQRKRSIAEELISTHKRLYILGKPGAGKTTFLKRLALQACKGKIEKTPIYVPLKEWSDSGENLDDFISGLFDVCGFPNAKEFIHQVLALGSALVLFDGLDEVNQDGPSRNKMINALEKLSKKYGDSTFCITCRIAANDYNFANFQYVEIADFNSAQKKQFIERWYSESPDKKKQFLAEWEKEESFGFRELAATPLLITLICLAFDDTLSFPRRRVELYQDAVDALLKKWDSSRGVYRSDLYRRLSLDRKKQLLARLASFNFEAGEYLLEKNRLISSIDSYLSSLPRDEDGAKTDAEDVLNAIEAQHGLLVERAHKIYSFSHLTLQEYFTSRYLLENQASGCLQRLITNAHEHTRWREVFLMTASMLDDASWFLKAAIEYAYTQLTGKPRLVALIDYMLDQRQLANSELLSSNGQLSTLRTLHREGGDVCEKVLDAVYAMAGELGVGHSGTPSDALSRARALSKLLSDAMANKPHAPIERLAKLVLYVEDDAVAFARYLLSCRLVVEALRLSIASDRLEIENMVLRPLNSAISRTSGQISIPDE